MPDGRVDLVKLLEGFVAFWRQWGDMLLDASADEEPETDDNADVKVTLKAYMQSVVDAGGFVDHDYAVGLGSVDLMVRMQYIDHDGKRATQREVLEVKVWQPRATDPLTEGLAELDGYLGRLNLDTGILVILDRRPDTVSMAERGTFSDERTPAGRTVTLLRL